MSTDIEALDELLAEISRSPTVARIRENAEDSGHVTQQVLEAYDSGRLADDEKTRLRRHILFCNDCAERVIPRRGSSGWESTWPLTAAPVVLTVGREVSPSVSPPLGCDLSCASHEAHLRCNL